jgi:CSLREA domain-containing protein
LADPIGPAGTCSLRDAITAANTKSATNNCSAGSGTDTIAFSRGLTGTITLNSTLPPITGNLTISGPTASPGITLDGNNKFQVVLVNSGAVLNLDHLTIAHGNSSGGRGGGGGGIFNQGTLIVTNSSFSGNSANIGDLGGGIFNEGTLIVTNSTFAGNSAANGGGIDNTAGTLTVTNSTFSGNSAVVAGGIDNAAGTVTVTNSTFASNSADTGGGIENDLLGTLTVTNSTFSGNDASNPGQPRRRRHRQHERDGESQRHYSVQREQRR